MDDVNWMISNGGGAREEDGTGRDAFKTRTHTSESGGKNKNKITRRDHKWGPKSRKDKKIKST